MSSQQFSFPPPPPPPPTASNSSQGGSPQWNSARGRGRGRDDSGRGRGGDRRPSRGVFGQSRGVAYDNTRGNQNTDFRGRGGRQDGRGQKRRHDQAFDHRNMSSVPPPVPSFGFQMPIAAPVHHSPKYAPTKSKLAGANLFGLTPSEDKDGPADEDEEAKYAAQAAIAAGLEFTYRGQTASLKSAADIAAWIAERRKRFPTKDKAEAAAAKAKAEAEERNRRKAEFAEGRRQRAESGRGRGRGRGRARGDTVVSDRNRPDEGSTKTNKLQKELMEARKRIAELEKKAGVPSSDAKPAVKGDDDADIEASMISSSDIGSDGEMALDDTEDETSSSGESSTEQDDDEDKDGAPTEQSSKRPGPEKVILPPRERREEKRACHEFTRTGRCSKGQRCQFKHDHSNASKHSKKGTRHGAVNGKTLYQRLTEQQREISDELVLQHVLYLGDKGYLAEPELADPATGEPETEDRQAT